MVKVYKIYWTALLVANLPPTTITWIVEYNHSYYAPSALKEFQNFKLKYHKIYTNVVEEGVRRMIFNANKKRIEEHNRKPFRTFDMGVTQFTDLTLNEFTKVLGTRLTSDSKQNDFEENIEKSTSIEESTTIDYQNDTCNAPVENQCKETPSCSCCLFHIDIELISLVLQ